MMNWGRKKPPSSSSSRPSSISRVFLMSWLSRFKKMDGSSESKTANAKRKGKKNSPSPSLPSLASWNGGRGYHWDSDSYWRLSFGEEWTEGDNGRGGLKSVWYDSDDEFDVPMSSSQSFKLRAVKVAGREENLKFDNLVADRRKMRESPRRAEILQRNDACKGKRESGEAEVKMMRSNSSTDKKPRKTNRRVLEEKQEELAREADRPKESSTESVEKDIFEHKPVRIIQTTEKGYGKSIASDLRRQRSVSFPNSKLWTIEEDCVFEALKFEQTNAFSKEESSSEWQKLKDMKINELMLKNGKPKKSVYSKESKRSRRKHTSRVEVCSPRTAAKIECKIKAFEDMKKAKMKTKKTTKKRAVKDATAFDSFAVVKSSIDPHQDFKDSMVEMITEKGIRRSEELEELLACYLTLNCDEYHDLIIKVFRQVWFDLNRVDQE